MLCSHTSWIRGWGGFLQSCSDAAFDRKGGTGSHRWTRPHVIIIILDEGGLGRRHSGRKPHKLQKLFEMVGAWNVQSSTMRDSSSSASGSGSGSGSDSDSGTRAHADVCSRLLIGRGDKQHLIGHSEIVSRDRRRRQPPPQRLSGCAPVSLRRDASDRLAGPDQARSSQLKAYYSCQAAMEDHAGTSPAGMARLKPSHSEAEEDTYGVLATGVAEQEANPLHTHQPTHLRLHTYTRLALLRIPSSTLIDRPTPRRPPRVSTAVIGTLKHSVGCAAAREELHAVVLQSPAQSLSPPIPPKLI